MGLMGKKTQQFLFLKENRILGYIYYIYQKQKGHNK